MLRITNFTHEHFVQCCRCLYPGGGDWQPFNLSKEGSFAGQPIYSDGTYSVVFDGKLETISPVFTKNRFDYPHISDISNLLKYLQAINVQIAGLPSTDTLVMVNYHFNKLRRRYAFVVHVGDDLKHEYVGKAVYHSSLPEIEYDCVNQILKYLHQNGLHRCSVSLLSDNELSMKQMSGLWAIRNGNYVEMARYIRRFAKETFKNITFTRLLETENGYAKELTNG